MRTLTVNEVDAVSGGAPIVPAAIAAAKACSKNTKCTNAVKGAAAVIAGAIAALIGYENNREG